MIKHYFKIAFRGLLKRKGHTLINILGLTIGITACLMIFVYVQQELSYDKFHGQSDKIYRIAREMTMSGQTSKFAISNYVLSDLIEENIPQVVASTRIGIEQGLMSNADQSKKFNEQTYHYTEPSFFQLFDCQFLSGSPQTALDAPNKIVLTQSMAKKYFGQQEPMNQVLTIDNKREFIVSGIIADWPSNSHMKFECLASLSTTKSFYGESMFQHWGNMWVYTYVLTNEAIEKQKLTDAITNMCYEKGPPPLKDLGVIMMAQPLEDIHLGSNLSAEMEANGSKIFVDVFIAVGVLILLIACFNFVNLATARASWRAKEVGLRKVVGAQKDQLVYQFLGESILLSLVSVILSILTFLLSIPIFNDFSGRVIEYSVILEPTILIFLILIMVIVGISAGCFPAFYLSSFKPVKVLKGNTNIGDSKFTNSLRKSLVTIQFAISICLVVASITIYSQLDHIQNLNLGMNKNQVIIVDFNNNATQEKLEIIKTDFEQMTSVRSVSAVSDTPPKQLNSWWIKELNNPEAQRELMPVLSVDENLVATLELNLTDGRNFDKSIVSDLKSGIILNQAAVEILLLESPIGTKLDVESLNYEVEVLGIVENFHFSTAHKEVGPLMLHIYPRWHDQLMIKTTGTNYKNIVAELETKWQTIFPDWEFSYHFLDQDFALAYRAEQQFSQLIFTFSGLAIFIGILGLLGLASYVAEQKIKEIGIRKVLGAKIGSVLWIQYRTFIAPLLIAFAISIPACIYFLGDWLNQFAYRIDLYWWLFALGGIVTVLFSIGTVSIHSAKAAFSNPVDSLRHE